MRQPASELVFLSTRGVYVKVAPRDFRLGEPTYSEALHATHVCFPERSIVESIRTAVATGAHCCTSQHLWEGCPVRYLDRAGNHQRTDLSKSSESEVDPAILQACKDDPQEGRYCGRSQKTGGHGCGSVPGVGGAEVRVDSAGERHAMGRGVNLHETGAMLLPSLQRSWTFAAALSAVLGFMVWRRWIAQPSPPFVGFLHPHSR